MIDGKTYVMEPCTGTVQVSVDGELIYEGANEIIEDGHDFKLTFRRPEVTAARRYFYPNGGWGGYDKFFEPAIPSRIQLAYHISRALNPELIKLDNPEDRRPWQEHCNIAIAILHCTHKKNVHVKGQPDTKVDCVPTEEAKVAAEYLEALIK